jgi:hypothetical protein
MRAGQERAWTAMKTMLARAIRVVEGAARRGAAAVKDSVVKTDSKLSTELL